MQVTASQILTLITLSKRCRDPFLSKRCPEPCQLAIKGTELQKEISKADVREAFDSPFEKTWTQSAKALEDLHIEIAKIGTTDEGKGGIMEGRAEKIKIKIIGVELTPNITEIGIWAEHDKALGELIAEKIRGEMQKESR